jgi:hypothetical protein
MVQPHTLQTTWHYRKHVLFLPGNYSKNTDTHTRNLFLITISSWVIISVWCRKMFYKNWENCATTNLSLRSVYRNCTSKEGHEETTHSFCIIAASGNFDMHICVRFIVASEISFPQKHCCATMNIVFLYIFQWRVSRQRTHRTHYCVSTAKMVARTQHNVASQVYCLACLQNVTYINCHENKFRRNRLALRGHKDKKLSHSLSPAFQTCLQCGVMTWTEFVTLWVRTSCGLWNDSNYCLLKRNRYLSVSFVSICCYLTARFAAKYSTVFPVTEQAKLFACVS